MAKFQRKIVEYYTTIGGGMKKVAETGTPEALGAGSAKLVVIRALAGNTASIVVGGSNASATPTSSPIGIPLANDAAPLEVKINDLSKVYIATAVADEGVSYIYYD